ncbi:hypothetical protein DWV06_09710 [Anaerosacchariphilus polymeriproducens]|uniref:Uncharacterized protein n=1 Tax=Anaerosacchariphilus polymeriproducens TaxID=1812858 RepID=A0A371AV46_9FIRM|nr:hypothetical protein DWV06_09710 [Anaerosacchariphilus polymeriproducens]
MKKAKKVLQSLNYTDAVSRYNNYYYICLKKKPLVDKAIEIKKVWVEEARKNLIEYENIKIN